MNKPTASLIRNYPTANDALLYERICIAEQDAYKFLKAAEELLKQATEEWSDCCTAKRIFEESEEMNNGRTSDYCC